MKTRLPRLFAFGALATATMTTAFAQDVRPGASANEFNAPGLAEPGGKHDTTAEANRADRVSAGVEQILKLAEAGISNEVIRTFVQTSPVAYELTVSDILALKSHGVADDITTTLMKRGAELRAQAGQTGAGAGAVQVPSRAVRFHVAPAYRQRGYIPPDPESYEYFQHYYLFPRTLAFTYQTLYPYSQPLSYGYLPQPFAARPPF